MSHTADSKQTGMQGGVWSGPMGQEGHPNDGCLSSTVKLFIFSVTKAEMYGCNVPFDPGNYPSVNMVCMCVCVCVCACVRACVCACVECQGPC